MFNRDRGTKRNAEELRRIAEILGVDIMTAQGLELFVEADNLKKMDGGREDLESLQRQRSLLVDAAALLKDRSPERRATVLHTLSNVHRDLADADPGRAREHLEEAISRQLEASAEPGRAESEYAADDDYRLAQLYDHRISGDPTKNHSLAVEYARRAIAGYPRAAMPVYWSDAQQVLGDILLGDPTGVASRDTDAAIACFDRALEVRSPQRDVVAWARTLWRRGVAFDARRGGDRGANEVAALRCFSDALTQLSVVDASDLWARLHDSAAVTLCQRQLGDPAEDAENAERHLQQCLSVWTKEASARDWARIQRALGALHDERVDGNPRTNHEKAVWHFQQALEVTTPETEPAEWGEGQRSLGIAYHNLAMVTHQDEHHALADEHLSAGLRVRTRENFPHEWAITVEVLAANRYSRGGTSPDVLKEGLRLLDQAAEVHRELGDRAALDTNRMVRRDLLRRHDKLTGSARDGEPDKMEEIAEAQSILVANPVETAPRMHKSIAVRLGELLAETGRWAEAAEAFASAMAADERLVSGVVTRAGRENRSEFALITQHAAYALARAGRLADAVVALERGRARMLGDRLGDNVTIAGRPGLDRLRTVAPHLTEEYLQARERLGAAQAADSSGSIGMRHAVFEKPATAAVVGGVARQIREARRQLDDALCRIRKVSGFADFGKPADLDTVLASAAPRCPLIYIASALWGTVMLVLSAAPDGQEVQVVWSDFTEDDAVSLLMHSDSEDGPYSFANGYMMRQMNLVETVFEDGNSALTIGSLFGPGVTQRTGRDEDGGMWRLGQRVVAPIVETLRRLNVEEVCLVVCGQLGQFPVHTAPLHAGADAECLLDSVDVAFAPSARVLLHARARAAEDWPPPMFGGLANPRPRSAPLAYAEHEVRRIGALFVQSEVRVGREATRDVALSAFRRASHVHLACHGAYQLGDYSPYLELEEGAELTLTDLLHERPFEAARLVTLSACQTAIPSAHAMRSTDIDGLPSALLAGGIPAVVATLWPVDDLSTTLLMERFYLYHLYGDPVVGEGPLPPHRALSRAQRWLAQVTAGELAQFFEQQPSLRQDVEALPSGQRYPAATAARNALRFGVLDAAHRPFKESWYWGPFVLLGA
ncbi:CHAT domain-containing protein [Streptomyces boninensis]|uniref:CHAT domain-containing protein n=1 Tax=Streptomyces boninensis TaxID=2039455 RepID=UPI003B217BEE